MVRTHRKDDRLRLIGLIVRHDLLDISLKLQCGYFCCDEFRAELFRVLSHLHAEIHAAYARHCGIIIYLIGVDDLAAAHEVLLDDDKVQFCTCRIDCCGESGRAGADDYEIIHSFLSFLFFQR